MISINPKKVFDFLFIIISSFVVAMAGNYFFGWDLQFGLMVGLILGTWNTIYDICVHIIMTINNEEEREEEV